METRDTGFLRLVESSVSRLAAWPLPSEGISTVSIEPEVVRVAVRDTGHGLRPESLPHLFEPFYTTKPDGMGLGLSICRSIIEAHGGRL